MRLNDGWGYAIIDRELFYYGYYDLDSERNIIKTGNKKFLQIESEENFVSISRNNSDVVLLSAEGNVYYIGEYPGHGVPTMVHRPTKIKFNLGVVAISRGYHCLFLTASGEVYGCGNNSNYEIRFGGHGRYYEPTRIEGIPEQIKAIQCADFYSVFLGESGIVYIMGKAYRRGTIGICSEDLIGCGTLVRPISNNIVKIKAKGKNLSMINYEGEISFLTFDYPKDGIAETPKISSLKDTHIHQIQFPYSVIDAKPYGGSLLVLTSDCDLYILSIEGKTGTVANMNLLLSGVLDFSESNGYSEAYSEFLILDLDLKLYMCGGFTVREISNVPRGMMYMSEDTGQNQFNNVKRAIS